MKQNLPPPAYQEYASNMLANYSFRALSPEARGVLYTLRLECWANKYLPSDLDALAKGLGFDRLVLERCLPNLSSFFIFKDASIYSQELEDYRGYLDHRRERQSEGGKKGANKTNSQRNADHLSERDTRRDTRESLVKQSEVQPSTAQQNTAINKGSYVHEEWLDDYENTDPF